VLKLEWVNKFRLSYDFCHTEASRDPWGKDTELCIRWARSAVLATYNISVIFSSTMSSVACNILCLKGGDSLACVHHLSYNYFLFFVTVWPTNSHT